MVAYLSKLFMLLLVLLCSSFGFAFQPLGQKYLPAEEAAVMTVINPLTASILGIFRSRRKHYLTQDYRIYLDIAGTLFI